MEIILTISLQTQSSSFSYSLEGDTPPDLQAYSLSVNLPLSSEFISLNFVNIVPTFNPGFLSLVALPDSPQTLKG